MSPEQREASTSAGHEPTGHEPTVETAIAPAEWPELIAYRLRPWAPSIVPAHARRPWMDDTPGGWVYRCLPMTVANQNGWMLLNPVEFDVVWNGSRRSDGLAFRFPRGRPSPLVGSIFGHGIVTWDIPYLFRTPPGYNLVVRGPTNLFKPGAHPLDGLVETDWAVATFTMNWKIATAFRRVRFGRDEPFCMIQPQARGEIEALRPEIRPVDSAPELEASHRSWAESRRNFAVERAGRPASAGPRWQRHYTRGRAPGGEVAPEHQKALRVPCFTDARRHESDGSELRPEPGKQPGRGRTAPGLAPEAPLAIRMLRWARFFLGALRR